MRVVWRSGTRESGALSVTMASRVLTPVSPVASWDSGKNHILFLIHSNELLSLHVTYFYDSRKRGRVPLIIDFFDKVTQDNYDMNRWR